MVVTLVGFPILVASLYAARGFADIERFRIRGVLNRPAPRPRYRRAPAGAGVWRSGGEAREEHLHQAGPAAGRGAAPPGTGRARLSGRLIRWRSLRSRGPVAPQATSSLLAALVSPDAA